MMAGEGTSSSSSKLQPEEPLTYLELEELLASDSDNDNPMPQVPPAGTVAEVPAPNQVLPVAHPLVQEGLPKNNTRKPKKSKSQIDKDHYDRKKAKTSELANNVEKLKNEKEKLEDVVKKSKEENTKLLAAHKSSEEDLAKAKENLIRAKACDGQTKLAMARLHKLIEEDVSFNIGKEDLWAKFCDPDGKQIFEKYYEDNEKYKHGFRTFVKMFLDLPQ